MNLGSQEASVRYTEVKHMTIKDMKTGQTATILKVGGEAALRQHFLDMGLIQGAEVTVIKYAPMGDPVELRIHGYELTIRLADAAQIEVSTVHDNEKQEKTDIRFIKTEHPGLGEGGRFHDKETENPLPDDVTLTFALVGNQNCGKTTLLIGFGCSVPGVMASRTLSSDRDRKMTILLTPFMSCSAKVPIYAFFSAAFFPEHAALVMIGLYFVGIVIGIIMALIFKKTLFKGEPVPFVMELPNYRMPGAKNVMQLLWEKAKDFLQKAFSIIFIATILIWFLQNFDIRLNVVTDSKDSILAAIASWISPIFRPLGFGDWRIATAVLTGVMAKESVVSTISILFGSTVEIIEAVAPAGVLAFLVFCLLYTPCIAAIASIKRELGGRYAVGVVIMQCCIAWIAALITHTIFMVLL